MKNYIIKSKIGTGTYGVVYKVTKKDLNKFFVLKQISLFGLPKDQIEEVQMEATILSKLNSKYVVQYFESFEEKNFLNIIMEYCDGGDLGQLLDKKIKKNEKQFEEDFIWKIFIQICLGLGYIHNQKILHRDLKTLNIFLTKDFNVKIGDLGVAKILTNQNFAKTFIGTPYYLSPELCEDKPYNEKSDVWALGVILYELCTFKHPFNAKSQAALIKKIAYGNYPPVEKYSVDLQKLVDFILIKNYIKRPSVYDILSRECVMRKAQKLGFLNDIILLYPTISVQIRKEPSFHNFSNSKKNSIQKSNSRKGKKNREITHKIGSRHENPVKIINNDVIYQNQNNPFGYNNYNKMKVEKKDIMDLGASDFFNNLNFNKNAKIDIQNFANNLNDYVPQYQMDNKINKDVTISNFIDNSKVVDATVSDFTKINNNYKDESKIQKDVTISNFIDNSKVVDATVSDFTKINNNKGIPNINEFIPNNKANDVTISAFIPNNKDVDATVSDFTKINNKKEIANINEFITNNKANDVTISAFIQNNKDVDATVSDFAKINDNNTNVSNYKKDNKDMIKLNKDISININNGIEKGDSRNNLINDNLNDLDSLFNEYESTKEEKEIETKKKETIKKEQPKKIEQIKKGTTNKFRRDEEFDIVENNENISKNNQEEEMVETANFKNNKEENISDEEINVKEYNYFKDSNSESNNNSEDETVITKKIENQSEDKSDDDEEENIQVKNNENNNNNECNNNENNEIEINNENNINKIKEINEEKKQLNEKIKKLKDDMCNLIGKNDFDYIMNLYKMTDNDDDISDDLLKQIEKFINDKKYSEEKKEAFDNLYYMLILADSKNAMLEKELKKYS